MNDEIHHMMQSVAQALQAALEPYRARCDSDEEFARRMWAEEPQGSRDRRFFFDDALVLELRFYNSPESVRWEIKTVAAPADLQLSDLPPLPPLPPLPLLPAYDFMMDAIRRTYCVPPEKIYPPGVIARGVDWAAGNDLTALVVTGEDGVILTLRPGQFKIEHSTFVDVILLENLSPEQTQALGRLIERSDRGPRISIGRRTDLATGADRLAIFVEHDKEKADENE